MEINIFMTMLCSSIFAVLRVPFAPGFGCDHRREAACGLQCEERLFCSRASVDSKCVLIRYSRYIQMLPHHYPTTFSDLPRKYNKALKHMFRVCVKSISENIKRPPYGCLKINSCVRPSPRPLTPRPPFAHIHSASFGNQLGVLNPTGACGNGNQHLHDHAL